MSSGIFKFVQIKMKHLSYKASVLILNGCPYFSVTWDQVL